MWKKARPGRGQTQTRPDQTGRLTGSRGGEGGETGNSGCGPVELWNSGEDGWLSTLYHGPDFFFILPGCFYAKARVCHTIAGVRKGYK